MARGVRRTRVPSLVASCIPLECSGSATRSHWHCEGPRTSHAVARLCRACRVPRVVPTRYVIPSHALASMPVRWFGGSDGLAFRGASRGLLPPTDPYTIKVSVSRGGRECGRECRRGTVPPTCTCLAPLYLNLSICPSVMDITATHTALTPRACDRPPARPCDRPNPDSGLSHAR